MSPLRAMETLMMDTAADAILTDKATEREYLLDRAAWLVRLRWFAVGGVTVAAAAAKATDFIPRSWPLFLVGTGLGLLNLVSWRRLRRMAERASGRDLARAILQQLLMDVGALAILLHYSGGAENPFVMIYAFPVAVGAMLLGWREVALLVLAAGLFHGAVVLGQSTGLLVHHSLHVPGPAGGSLVEPLYKSARFVTGYLVAYAAMLAGVTYFVRSVAVRYRKSEAIRRQHDRVAMSRERLARMGEISAGVAHAVRNPLHGLLNSVDLLRPRLSGDAASQETLALMVEALGHIEVVTRRLLTLARDSPLDTAPCDVDALIADTLKLASAASRRSLAVIEAAPGGAGWADLDAHRFGEALANVVDNALDACRDGGTVTVRSAAPRGAQGPIELEVVDTGPGIPPEDLRRVFDPFFTTKAVGEGTGLGLAIARRIVEEHGGQLTVESAPGQGTRVRFVVPRRR